MKTRIEVTNGEAAPIPPMPLGEEIAAALIEKLNHERFQAELKFLQAKEWLRVLAKQYPELRSPVNMALSDLGEG